MSWLFHRWLVLCGVSLVVIKGCRCFFLRHTSSGKCIAAAKVPYRDNRYGRVYWAELLDCLDFSAQLRYLRGKEVLHNIARSGSLLFGEGSSFKQRMVAYDANPIELPTWESDPRHRMRQNAAGSLFFYDSKTDSCAQADNSEKFIMRKKNGCNDTEEQQKFTFGSVTQFGNKMKDVHCSPIQRMLIRKAHYGDFNNSGTFNANAAIDIQCSGLTSCQVKPLCGGNRSCELTVDNNLLSPFCSDTTKQLYIEYICVDNYPNLITTASNIRLSKSPNEGFIEVKNDTTWRKIIEENWDKDRQKMLCKHLGFSETSANPIRTMEITANEEIASGDLVCYNTGSGGTSCCVHLVPSTTTAKVDITYAECKICDNQLLNNESTFPDNIFRGNGGNSFYEARFTKGGWCSSTSGSYLTIDLQKEYHITRVLVIGDKDQTKWSRSYSLKYSHNESLVDSSRVVQILGNTNGYQASTTDVDIYNARFLKIESTGNTDFCLRIELCGLAQKPVSVSDIQITTFERSARVTWSIETSPKASSYITKLEIYLNDDHRGTVFRGNSYQFDISNLTPFTNYTVGIEAVDGSSESSRINTDFETKEAVPSGPPLDAKFESRGKTTLQLSWMDPRSYLHNGILTGYQVCYSSETISTSPKCNETKTTLSFTIDDLRPSTKYFVTVAAGTSAGFGNKSGEINKTTNGDPVKPVANSSSSLNINLSKPDKYIQDMIIIVQTAENVLEPVEEVKTSDLKPYQSNTQDAYITAYLKTDVLPSSFVIGDGKEYNSKTVTYVNQPLQTNSSYNVFLRFFESQGFFYSTEWSESVKTMAIPPAPVISKITPTGRNEYNISWYQPSLPDQQTVLKYHVNYSASSEPTKRSTVPKENKFIIIVVDYDKQYTINVRVETEAGQSVATLKSWLSLSKPLEIPKRLDDGYTVILRKPKEKNIRMVALVLLLSDSSEPPAPESIKIKSSIPSETKTGDAFIAKEFTIGDFQGDEIEILLRKFKENRRRKREAVQVEALKPKVKYRATQMNTDEFGNRTWSYWSEEFGAVTAPSGPPLNVTFISRSKTSLGISWKAPVESTRKSKFTGYRVCFFTNDTSPECLILKSPKVFSLALKNLRPSTKYFVTVSASTEHGYGEKSPEVSKITNKGPVNLIATSFYTMTVNIPKQQEYIKEVMVIVKSSANDQVSSEGIKTSDLKNFQSNTRDPYITAYLKADVLPLTFVIGDGKSYSSEDKNYHNQPLTANSNYVVFLRFFESQDSYYSTEWSDSIYTMAKHSELGNADNCIRFLIPMIILALCFLLLLGVIIYQRRLNRKNEFDGNKEPKIGNKYVNEGNSVYETPDDVIEEIERNEGVRGTDKGQESSDYMSLKDKREPTNVYQALQPDSTNDGQSHSKMGGQNPVEYQNPVFSADPNAA
ncbi:receptor-type tyrosine-protein phosphatase F-like [Dendronephthya gigantea]|uniref:receptor-type tyrosine-protein phosphatase F-like n=1 Tax=Dendronephthya gigantea TaxID=151771 RepID=UPI00106CF232|nr:receptor-type tyrosine-protein phosphatase F-like [Dendronephthya gigantea]